MGKAGRIKHKYGLIGRDIAYSFSRTYFTQKFKDEGWLDRQYSNFDLPSIDQYPELLRDNPDLSGLNVTIPYKETIIPYLDDVTAQAAEIGAVNTIQFTPGGTVGHNTDVFGFRMSLENLLLPDDRSALILGTGGASKAVAYVLGHLGIDFTFVSRNPTAGQIGYNELTAEILAGNSILINCTPLGTFPEIQQMPPIPYRFISERHLLFDLVYNPPKTRFLADGEVRGARILNGLPMLRLQAEKAWEIWNTPGN